MEIGRVQAVELAKAKVAELERGAGCALELMNDKTKEIDRGWIFFFNSVEFLRTGNNSFRLAGNGPIFVSRLGSVHELPSRVPWEQSIDSI